MDLVQPSRACIKRYLNVVQSNLMDTLSTTARNREGRPLKTFKLCFSGNNTLAILKFRNGLLVCWQLTKFNCAYPSENLRLKRCSSGVGFGFCKVLEAGINKCEQRCAHPCDDNERNECFKQSETAGGSETHVSLRGRHNGASRA
ncbi:hypothetical protein C8D92_101278 [Tamilnaduibacter salinus]|uniref:Uncharacterized protein n=1 Tax=Tamilnaduibacter salinus TaxID=1484056 RepID=A0A2U1D111_9GAMM|nr:hypothetical protein C8D92_101278 [Tamilnaduibacter salinus]